MTSRKEAAQELIKAQDNMRLLSSLGKAKGSDVQRVKDARDVYDRKSK